MATTIFNICEFKYLTGPGGRFRKQKNDKSAVLGDTSRLDNFYQHNTLFSYTFVIDAG